MFAIDRAIFLALATGYETVALYALAVYDWLLCLEGEGSFVLTAKLKPAKLAYILCRYWPIVTVPISSWIPHDPSICPTIFRVPMMFQTINFAAVAWVMGIRAHAFTGRKTMTAVILTGCAIIVAVYQLFVLLTQVKVAPAAFGSCFPVDIGKAKHLAGFFLAPVLFDFIVNGFILVHAFRTIPFGMLNSMGITQVFLKDGILYFFAISSLHFINAALLFQPDVAISGLGVGASKTLPNILACRMVLNLRDAMNRDDSDLSHPYVDLLASGRDEKDLPPVPSDSGPILPIFRPNTGIQP